MHCMWNDEVTQQDAEQPIIEQQPPEGLPVTAEQKDESAS